jgi:hypothetical protein
MRAADVTEKVTAQHPEFLGSYKTDLVERVAPIDQQEVRWHVAQMLPRLALTSAERESVVTILLGYLEDTSRIVQVNAMQALADMATSDVALRQRVVAAIRTLVATGSAAVKNRGQKLLERLV